MEKRMILAVVLSLMVLFVFQFFSPRPQRQVVTGTTAPEAVPESSPVAISPAGQALQGIPEGGAIAGAQADAAEEKTTEIMTDGLLFTFSGRWGGSVKQTTALNMRNEELNETILDTTAGEPRPFSLISPEIPELAKAVFDVKKRPDALEYSYVSSEGLTITKEYNFHNSFNYNMLKVTIKNGGSIPAAVSYQIVGPTQLEAAGQIRGRNFEEANILVDGKIWKTRSVKQSVVKTGNIAWIAIKNRYFAFIMKPLFPVNSAVVQETADKQLVTVFNRQKLMLAPGASVSDEYVFYLGPLDEQKILSISDDMTGIVDMGFFGGVSKMLLSMLKTFHGWTHNWGVAIIMLTMVINLVLFPLTIKSLTSMHQMKKVQPHMQKLRELHKDNPQKLNKEMMELYRKYNVNPLGGCLPLLLQMPIFIAFYQGLMRSVALKGANFLWIKDLSRPDAVPLPFSLPVIGASINILPLLMVGMMVLQQKVSQGASGAAMTEDQAGQQKMMMVMFPLFFGFLFYSMPAGLVLYWLTNTVLMTIEHTIIGRRMASAT